MKGIKSPNTVQMLILCNMLLAFIAFIKDMFLASYFGTSQIADAYNFAFFLPDTIGNNLIGATLMVSNIPVLTKLFIAKDQEYYNAAIKNLSTYVLATTLLVLIVMDLSVVPLIHLFNRESNGITLYLTRYFYFMSPIFVASPFWLLGSSILQTSNRFIIPAVTPILYNLFLLLGLITCQILQIPQVIGGSIISLLTAGSTIIVGIFTWYYLGRKPKINWKIKELISSWDWAETKEMLRIFIAYFLILFFGQAALFMERFFANSLETGTLSALTYAYRIAQFPLWVFIAAINTFILPTISAHVLKNDKVALKRDILKSFLFVILASTCLSLILVIFSYPLINLTLGRGAFGFSSISLTSTILKGYGLSIVGQSLFVFCTRYYVAERKMRIPLVVGLMGSVLNIILLKVLIPIQGPSGIGYAIAVSATFNGFSIIIYFIKDLFAADQKGEITL